MCRSSPSWSAERGVSLLELLVVVALLALGLMVTVPLFGQRVHDIKVRAAVSEFTVALRAARMVAVARGAPVEVDLSTADGTYGYRDASGEQRTFRLPPGSWFDGETSPAIVFGPDGSVTGLPQAVIGGVLSAGTTQAWIVQVPASGIPVVRSGTAAGGWGGGPGSGGSGGGGHVCGPGCGH